MGNWIPLLGIVVVFAVVIGIILMIYSSYSRYRRLAGFLKWFGVCCGYFGKGLVGVGVFGGLYYVSMWLFGGVAEGKINLLEILMWTGIAIGAFFGIAGLGYVLDRFWKRMTAYKKRHKGEVR